MREDFRGEPGMLGMLKIDIKESLKELKELMSSEKQDKPKKDYKCCIG